MIHFSYIKLRILHRISDENNLDLNEMVATELLQLDSL